MAVGKLPVRSCLIDGEAIVCDENGLAVFDLIRRHGALASAVHCAFDLLELDGQDLRREPIEKRKASLAKLLKGAHLSIVLNECFEEDVAIVFREACKLGCEGIVSKRLGSLYRSGHSPHRHKIKNPRASAVKREAEEDWGRRGHFPTESKHHVLAMLRLMQQWRVVGDGEHHARQGGTWDFFGRYDRIGSLWLYSHAETNKSP